MTPETYAGVNPELRFLSLLGWILEDPQGLGRQPKSKEAFAQEASELALTGLDFDLTRKKKWTSRQWQDTSPEWKVIRWLFLGGEATPVEPIVQQLRTDMETGWRNRVLAHVIYFVRR